MYLLQRKCELKQIFVGDLNRNGVKEVAFPTNEGIKFFEFAFSNKANTPYDLTGYSKDSSSIYLTMDRCRK